MPILWSFSLGPLLDLTQFRTYIDVIKSLSQKIEREQIRKLQELGSHRGSETRSTSSTLSPAASNGQTPGLGATGTEDDFAKLVLGNKAANANDPFAGALTDGQKLTQNPPSFSWTSTNTAGGKAPTPIAALQPQPASRSITPDVTMSAFPSLQPTSSSSAGMWGATSPPVTAISNRAIPQYSNFAIPAQPQANALQSQSQAAFPQPHTLASPPILPPPPSNPGLNNAWKPNYTSMNTSLGQMGVLQPQSNTQNSSEAVQPPQQQTQKTGLDKYQSLL
jgi:SCY1-like protein 2